MSFMSRRKRRRRLARQQKQLGPKGTAILGLLFLLVGVGGLYKWGINLIQEAMDSENWLPVEATVVKSVIGSKRSSGSNSSTTYYLNIAYNYQVEGNSYQGTRVRVGSGNFSSSNYIKYRDWKRMYPRNSRITAYYSPTNPSKSAIQKGIYFESYFVSLIFGVFALFGGMMIPAAFKKSNKSDFSRPSNVIPIRPKKHDDAASFQELDGDMSGQWYVLGGDKKYGPYTEQKMITLYYTGKIKDQHVCESVDGSRQETVYTILKQAKKAA
jgi:hypothetical protein